jgi:hypothetical protein
LEHFLQEERYLNFPGKQIGMAKRVNSKRHRRALRLAERFCFLNAYDRMALSMEVPDPCDYLYLVRSAPAASVHAGYRPRRSASAIALERIQRAQAARVKP